MKQYGLIGNPLGHSWSQRWFEAMFEREDIIDACYSLYPMPSLPDLRQWVADNHICGFNVTIPYKQAVIPYLDSIDEAAQSIGAVNCVEVHDGRLIGHNTDAPAFLSTLQPLLQSHHTHALLLGTGGAAHAVAHALQLLGIHYQPVSRNPYSKLSISYSTAAHLASTHLLIINATPVGMYPDVDSTPWTYPNMLSSHHLCYDLVYNPSPTRFLREAATAGASTIGGLSMLQRQAQLSWEIWNR